MSTALDGEPPPDERCGIPHRRQGFEGEPPDKNLVSEFRDCSEPVAAAPTVAEILQDRGAFLAVCEELAECLLARARAHEQAAAEGARGFDFWAALPLMCAFPSPDHMRLMAVRLRAAVRKLKAMPASREELARVISDPGEAFAAFDHALFADMDGEELPGLRNSAGHLSNKKGGVS